MNDTSQESVALALCARFCKDVEQTLLDMAPLPCAPEDIGPFVEQVGATFGRLLSEAADPEPWLHFRIGVAPGDGPNVVAGCIAPRLAELESEGSAIEWWWLNKADACGSAVRLRVRVRQSERATLRARIRARLREAGLTVSEQRYEPEFCLFGGPAGMRIAHEHFCADSRFLVRWATAQPRRDGSLIPDGLSLALALHLFRTAGLDLFEAWDVFSRVLDKRRFRVAPSGLIESGRTLVRRVLTAGPDGVFTLYEGHAAALLADHGRALERVGSALSRAASEGRLECGVRELLAPLVLFHWNRAGLSAVRQCALASAIVEEMRHLARRATADLPE
jgi:thiopeptide-type bacteriocin biosynthesis protein